MPYNKFIDPWIGFPEGEGALAMPPGGLAPMDLGGATPMPVGGMPIPPGAEMPPAEMLAALGKEAPGGAPGFPGPPLSERPNIPRDKWEKVAMAVIALSMLAGKKRRGIHELGGAYLKARGGQRMRADAEWQQEKARKEKQEDIWRARYWQQGEAAKAREAADSRQRATLAQGRELALGARTHAEEMADKTIAAADARFAAGQKATLAEIKLRDKLETVRDKAAEERAAGRLEEAQKWDRETLRIAHEYNVELKKTAPGKAGGGADELGMTREESVMRQQRATYYAQLQGEEIQKWDSGHRNPDGTKGAWVKTRTTAPAPGSARAKWLQDEIDSLDAELGKFRPRAPRPIAGGGGATNLKDTPLATVGETRINEWIEANGPSRFVEQARALNIEEGMIRSTLEAYRNAAGRGIESMDTFLPTGRPISPPSSRGIGGALARPMVQ